MDILGIVELVNAGLPAFITAALIVVYLMNQRSNAATRALVESQEASTSLVRDTGAQMHRLEGRCDALSDENRKNIAANLALERTIIQKSAELTLLQDDLVDTNKQLATTQKQLKTQTTLSASHAETIARLERELATRTKEADDLTAHVAALEAQLKQRGEALEAAEETINELGRQIKDLTGKLEEANGKRLEVEKEHAKVERRRLELMTTVDALTKRIEELEKPKPEAKSDAAAA